MTAIALAERGLVPASIVRLGIRRLLVDRLRLETEPDESRQGARLHAFVKEMSESPLALHADAANSQHYEVPSAFFELVMGRHMKYSCCYFDDAGTDLSAAEARMLALTCERARLANGMRVLELGCGWGSLTLWMAEQYPASEITAISNSASQRELIEARAAERNLTNVRVLTADMNDFATKQRFDRVVSVEMFEHMRNWQVLFERIASWLEPDGALFFHVFCHRTLAYPFETDGNQDWMARHFFTGGLMPSAELPLHFKQDLRLSERHEVNGRHYERTANAWLTNLERQREAALDILAEGANRSVARIRYHRWRIFFIACAELFGYRAGREWFVSHYLCERADSVEQTGA